MRAIRGGRVDVDGRGHGIGEHSGRTLWLALSQREQVGGKTLTGKDDDKVRRGVRSWTGAQGPTCPVRASPALVSSRHWVPANKVSPTSHALRNDVATTPPPRANAAGRQPIRRRHAHAATLRGHQCLAAFGTNLDTFLCTLTTAQASLARIGRIATHFSESARGGEYSSLKRPRDQRSESQRRLQSASSAREWSHERALQLNLNLASLNEPAFGLPFPAPYCSRRVGPDMKLPPSSGSRHTEKTSWTSSKMKSSDWGSEHCASFARFAMHDSLRAAQTKRGGRLSLRPIPNPSKHKASTTNPQRSGSESTHRLL